MADNSKQNRGETKNPFGLVRFRSKWKSLNSLQRLVESSPFIVDGKDFTGFRNTTFRTVFVLVRTQSKEWEEEYNNMNVTNDYERGKKEGCLELIRKRLLN
ncbi:MAG: hypothetical protein Q8O88_01270 [bacterium]|nr:hypothetical protein [bacterium]